MKKGKKENKRIYLDFEDWWAHGKHGYSSYSWEYARELWDDFEPTIKASRSELDEQMVLLQKEKAKWNVKFQRNFLNYLKEFNLEEKAGVKFFRWFADQWIKEAKEKKSKFK